jgi:photosystem II stability/assembly factor-like uncharacterized protein
LRSTDGGNQWTRLNLPTTDSAFLDGMSMLDEDNGIVHDSNANRYFRTSDGGATWKAFQGPTPDGMKRSGIINLVYPFPFVLIGFVRDYDTPNYAIIRSTDNGKTWRSFPAPKGIGISALFLDNNEGWAIVYGGEIIADRRDVIYHTTNGGETWTTQLDTHDSTGGLEGIDFADQLNGLAVGNLGAIYRTTDGGGHWIREAKYLLYDNGPSFRSVASWATGTQIAVDWYNDTIYRHETAAGINNYARADTSSFQIYPNLLRDGNPMSISFMLSARATVRATVVNAVGEDVGRVIDSPMEAGRHTLQWKPDNPFARGSYFVRLSINDNARALPFIVLY